MKIRTHDVDVFDLIVLPRYKDWHTNNTRHSTTLKHSLTHSLNTRAPTWNQANEASGFELRVIKAGTSRSSAYAQPVSFGFGSIGFGKVCLTPNKSIKSVYHFCSIGSVNTGTLLSSTILSACNCCIIPQELQGQFCQQASSLLNALFYLGLCQPGTCVASKVSFPPSN